MRTVLNFVFNLGRYAKNTANSIFGSHFVFGHFEAFRVTAEGDRQQKWTQHTQIMIKKSCLSAFPQISLSHFMEAHLSDFRRDYQGVNAFTTSGF